MDLKRKKNVKTIEIIIRTSPVLNELSKYGYKILMLATFGPLGINPVTVSSFFRGTFFLSKFGDQTVRDNIV